MKRTLFGVLSLVLMSSIVMAGETRSVRSALSSTLLGQLTPIPIPDASSTMLQAPTDSYAPVATFAQPLELFPDVRYHATRNIACNAVPMIIQVADPCNKDRCCRTCVSIQVCVPPCDPSCVKVRRDGAFVRYEFGKYAVTARTIGNHVSVRYED